MTMFFVSSSRFDAVLADDLDLSHGRDASGAVEHLDLVLPEQELDALDVAVDALVLERHHLRQIERRLAHARCRWPAK